MQQETTWYSGQTLWIPPSTMETTSTGASGGGGVTASLTSSQILFRVLWGPFAGVWDKKSFCFAGIPLRQWMWRRPGTGNSVSPPCTADTTPPDTASSSPMDGAGPSKQDKKSGSSHSASASAASSQSLEEDTVCELSGFEHVHGDGKSPVSLTCELPLEARKRKASRKGRPIGTVNQVPSIAIEGGQHQRYMKDSPSRTNARQYTPSVSIFALAGNAVTNNYHNKCIEIWRISESLHTSSNENPGDVTRQKPWVSCQLPSRYTDGSSDNWPLFTCIETVCPGINCSSSPESTSVGLWAYQRCVEALSQHFGMTADRTWNIVKQSVSNLPAPLVNGAWKTWNRTKAKYQGWASSLSEETPRPFKFSSTYSESDMCAEAAVWLTHGSGGLVLASDTFGEVHFWGLPSCLMDANGEEAHSEHVDSSLNTCTNILTRKPIYSIDSRFDSSEYPIQVVSLIWLGFITDLIPDPSSGETHSPQHKHRKIPSVNPKSYTQQLLWKHRYCPFFAIAYSDSMVLLCCLTTGAEAVKTIATVDVAAALSFHQITEPDYRPHLTKALWNPSYLGVRPIQTDNEHSGKRIGTASGLGLVLCFEDSLTAQVDILRGFSRVDATADIGGELVWHSRPPACFGLQTLTPSCMILHPVQPVFLIGYKCTSETDNLSSFRVAVVSGTTGNVDHFLEKPFLRCKTSSTVEVVALALDSTGSRLVTSVSSGDCGEVAVWNMQTQNAMSCALCSSYVSGIEVLPEISPIDWPLEETLVSKERPSWASKAWQHMLLTMFGPGVSVYSYRVPVTSTGSQVREQYPSDPRKSSSRSSNLARKYGHKIPSSKGKKAYKSYESSCSSEQFASCEGAATAETAEDPSGSKNTGKPKSLSSTRGGRGKGKGRLGKLDKEASEALKRAYYGSGSAQK
eukprot:gb/GECG01004867.1/.p1 GENE.gb/GECG01004867.1/~~gb/GECG01004867.1/.p1  ORF type:complete len:910 (+),score=94.99 gb/GECG01004867.1/:1-2730(+)